MRMKIHGSVKVVSKATDCRKKENGVKILCVYQNVQFISQGLYKDKPYNSFIAIMEVSSLHVDERYLDVYSEIEDPKSKQKNWFQRACDKILPSHRVINLCITRFLVFMFFGMFMYGMLEEDVLPGSELFSLFLLAILATIGGQIVGLMTLPPLLGMMIVGFIFRNVENPLYENISLETIMSVKEMALAFILMRAGLSIDSEKLMKLKFVVLRLVLIPCIIEATTVGVIAHFLLDLPFIFSCMLGWLMSSISPEVVMPIILKHESKGYGVKKGIPTLIIAACSLDDILGIACFTVCFSIAFSTENLAWTIVKGPLEPLVGLAFGSVFGVIFWHFPSPKMRMNKLVYYNVLLLSFSSTAILFFSVRFRLPGAGPLGSIILAFVAGIRWRHNEKHFYNVQYVIKIIWYVMEPFLFSLIGAEVTLDTLRTDAGFATLAIFSGLSLRYIVTIITCIGAGFNIKEKVFIASSWISKATVQAAIGSQALDYARQNKLDAHLVRYGTVVLSVCVLSILYTAPLGAILANALGPVLLTKDEESPGSSEFYEKDSQEKPEESAENSAPEGKTSSTTLVKNDNERI
ncbi:hypothetical protein TNCT_38741 [Trichonephila clavata]|uniref:Cation/H+ exchanger transmembrane domain-containing protein n=1 Tax=Trichonephila clavata TaxID=2740835 RepID=A0A8X6KX77_TRICU|nr:hypothetical protein TNCT_38741 [Trichonephila clavata]